MKTSHDSENEQLEDELDAIKALYVTPDDYSPSQAIDRNIIAAAYREMENPQPRQVNHRSVWRRLLLPVYVLASFAFTSIAAHWFWPSPDFNRSELLTPSSSFQLDSVDAESYDIESSTDQITLDSGQSASRNRQTYAAPMVPPSGNETINSARQATSGVRPMFEFDQGIDVTAGQGDSLQPNLNYLSEPLSDSTDGLKPTVDPAKWARTIIELVKQGKTVEARSEFIKFKKSFPAYPLEEQIESLRH